MRSFFYDARGQLIGHVRQRMEPIGDFLTEIPLRLETVICDGNLRSESQALLDV